MELPQLLSLVKEIAQKSGITTPFIVGGTPRDKLLNRLNQLADIDLTTGDESIHLLGAALAKKIPGQLRTFSDRHSSFTVDGVKLDFSSNFRVPGVQNMLQQAGLANPSAMQCELYSRDFTCNALLLSLDLKNIYDPTGLGIKDIDNKLIRTCLPAALTLGAQPKRIPRIIYLAAKLNFEVDGEIIDWVVNNPAKILEINKISLAKKIRQGFYADKDKTLRLISQMNMWRYIPVISELIPYMDRPRRI